MSFALKAKATNVPIKSDAKIASASLEMVSTCVIIPDAAGMIKIFIIPAASGIITQVDTISNEALAILASLFIGTFVALAFSAKLIDVLISYKEKNHES